MSNTTFEEEMTDISAPGNETYLSMLKKVSVELPSINFDPEENENADTEESETESCILPSSKRTPPEQTDSIDEGVLCRGSSSDCSTGDSEQDLSILTRASSHSTSCVSVAYTDQSESNDSALGFIGNKEIYNNGYGSSHSFLFPSLHVDDEILESLLHDTGDNVVPLANLSSPSEAPPYSEEQSCQSLLEQLDLLCEEQREMLSKSDKSEHQTDSNLTDDSSNSITSWSTVIEGNANNGNMLYRPTVFLDLRDEQIKTDVEISEDEAVVTLLNKYENSMRSTEGVGLNSYMAHSLGVSLDLDVDIDINPSFPLLECKNDAPIENESALISLLKKVDAHLGKQDTESLQPAPAITSNRSNIDEKMKAPIENESALISLLKKVDNHLGQQENTVRTKPIPSVTSTGCNTNDEVEAEKSSPFDYTELTDVAMFRHASHQTSDCISSKSNTVSAYRDLKTCQWQSEIQYSPLSSMKILNNTITKSCKINNSDEVLNVNERIKFEPEKSLSTDNTTDVKEQARHANEAHKIENEILNDSQLAIDRSKILYHKNVSFQTELSALPNDYSTSPRLLLKISLSSSNICQRIASKSALSLREGSDVFVLLMVFFTSLFKDATCVTPFQMSCPFKVISIVQAMLDDELCLLISVCENNNMQDLKRRKNSKGGASRSLHRTIRQFFQSHSIQDIWKTISSLHCMIRYIDGYLFNLPLNDKLSGFIHVSADDQSVERIFSLPPAVIVNNIDQRQMNLTLLETLLPSSNNSSETIILVISDVAKLYSSHMFMLLTTIASKSMDISGVRMIYNTTSGSASIGKASLVLAIRHSSTVKAMQQHFFCLRDLPCLKLTFANSAVQINFTQNLPLADFNFYCNQELVRSEVVQWFGPRFFNASDLSEYLHVNCDSLLHRNKDFILRNTTNGFITKDSSLVLLNEVKSRVALFITTDVPSFITWSIPVEAQRRGLVTISMCKRSFTKQELSSSGLRFTQSESMLKNSNLSGIFPLWVLLLEGENAAFRVKGLLDNFMENKLYGEPKLRQSGDTLGDFIVDKYITVCEFNKNLTGLLRRSHNSPISSYVPSLIPHYNTNTSTQLDYCLVIAWGLDNVFRLPKIIENLIDFFGCQCNYKQSSSRILKQNHHADIYAIKIMSQLSKNLAKFLTPESIFDHNKRKQIIQSLEIEPVVIIAVHGNDMTKHLSHQYGVQHSEQLKSKLLFYDNLDYQARALLRIFSPLELLSSNTTNNVNWPIYTLNQSPHCLLINEFVESISRGSKIATITLDKSEVKRDIVSFNIPTALSIYPWTWLSQSKVIFGAFKIHYSAKCTLSIIKTLQRTARRGLKLIGMQIFLDGDKTEQSIAVIWTGYDAIKHVSLSIHDAIADKKETFRLTYSTDHDGVLKDIQDFKSQTKQGIHDDSLFSIANNVNFTGDPVFSSDVKCSLVQLQNTHHPSSTSSLLELNVLLFSNVLIRGTNLGDQISDKLTYLGLWRLLEGLDFQTHASRMTSLNQSQIQSLFSKSKIPPLLRGRKLRRFNDVNGQLVALVVSRDFAVTNFRVTLQRFFSDEELLLLETSFHYCTSNNEVDFMLHAIFKDALEIKISSFKT